MVNDFRREVTFVMPAFNAEKYIGEAIRSVINQSFTDWELVVVDDGSTDSTPDIVRSYAENNPNIRLLFMDSPSGSAYQPRKRAIIEAKAPIVAPIDADDVLPENYLLTLLNRRQNTNADIVYPTAWLFNETSEPELFLPSDKAIAERVYAGRDAVELTLCGWKINCGGGLISRQLYIDCYKMYDANVNHVCADELLSRQLLFNSEKVAFSDAKYFYRKNQESVTRRKSVRSFDFLLNDRLLADFVKSSYPLESPVFVAAQQHIANGIIDALSLINGFGLSENQRREVFQSIEISRSLLDLKLLKRNRLSKSMIVYSLLQWNLPLAASVFAALRKIKSGKN